MFRGGTFKNGLLLRVFELAMESWRMQVLYDFFVAIQEPFLFVKFVNGELEDEMPAPCTGTSMSFQFTPGSTFNSWCNTKKAGYENYCKEERHQLKRS